jgi:hypothetical protein
MPDCEGCGKPITATSNYMALHVVSFHGATSGRYDLGDIYFHNDCFYSIRLTFMKAEEHEKKIWS